MFVVDMRCLHVCLALVFRSVGCIVDYCYFDFEKGDSYSCFACRIHVGVGYWGVVGLEMAALV